MKGYSAQLQSHSYALSIIWSIMQKSEHLYRFKEPLFPFSLCKHAVTVAVYLGGKKIPAVHSSNYVSVQMHREQLLWRTWHALLRFSLRSLTWGQNKDVLLLLVLLKAANSHSSLIPDVTSQIELRLTLWLYSEVIAYTYVCFYLPVQDLLK